MKKIILIFGVFIYTLISNAQVAGTLSISDTRSINDAPNFIEHSIRSDFKERNIIGVPGNGLYSTNLTIAQWEDTDNSGGANHQLNFNDGGVFYRNAYPLDSQWGKWQQLLMTNIDGNVGIGVLNPLNKLDVNGTIHSKEVKVDMNGWSDFVFKKEYNLPTLEQVEKHIVEKGHLENIPSEKEVLENGINLGEMNAKLLQKIEELTLYMIEMKKENLEIKNENDLMKKNQVQLENRILSLENR